MAHLHSLAGWPMSQTKTELLLIAVDALKRPFRYRPALAFLALLCGHGGRSDVRHGFTKAVVRGHGGKWLGRVE